jgi:hypothetical protein
MLAQGFSPGEVAGCWHVVKIPESRFTGPNDKSPSLVSHSVQSFRGTCHPC